MARVLETCGPQYEFLNKTFLAPVKFNGHGAYLQGLLEKPFVRIKHVDSILVTLQYFQDKMKTTKDVGEEMKLKFKVKQVAREDL